MCKSVLREIFRAGSQKLRQLSILLMLAVVFTLPGFGKSQFADFADKLPAALVSDLDFLLENPEYDYPLPLIIQMKRGSKLPREGKELRLINGYKHYQNINQLLALLHNPNVEYVTIDTKLSPTLFPSSNSGGTSSYLESIGADQAQAMGYDGSGIGIAVLDSGVINQDLQGRVVHRVDFTSGFAAPVLSLLKDPYGHGSHVAGIAAGDGSQSSGLYRGVAPGANIISVQVVDANGFGLISNLINAIDWVIQNKDLYNIRVVNMSLGSPPLESYLLDPLCQAVDQMVQAGIVTVASAGNFGKNAANPEIWRSITSPGNSPAVITVGAINTKDTADNDDDIATTFSSRGPTYPDDLFKPDVTAPGNAIPATRVAGSWIDVNYPQFQLAGNSSYLSMSGSSMATAFVSGTAALMLEANPDLSPRLVKMLIMLSAIKLDEPHLLEQGNGLVNTFNAVRLAEVTDVANKSVGTHLVPPGWTRNGKQVLSGGALAKGKQVVYSNLVSNVPASGFWGHGVSWKNHISWSTGASWADDLLDSESEVWGDGFVWTDGMFWADSTVWGGATISTDGVLWVDAVFWTDAIVWVDGAFWTDMILWTDSAIDGGGN